MKKIRNQKGVSLIELIAGIPIATLLFATLILAMVHFVKTYQETKLFLQLQEDLYQTIEYMRYGHAHETETEGEQLIGLMTARDVQLSAAGNYLQIFPLMTNQTYAGSFWTRYTVNDDHQMEVRSRYGNSKTVETMLIFPRMKFHENQQNERPKKFGNEPQFEIMNPRDIWTVHVDDGGNAMMVDIRLEGKVRYRERQDGQSTREDIAKNTRTIVYETSVFLGNAVH
ncbi:MAG: type II secretion system GspH family protein [Candidatus Cloacimonetes bacterium]|nr:type II secretion system GspH family protein [Candidatus Cloacimonadota bacterium]MCF7814152.1 type II secretion system GspH family protein [Candidatus Cloacimonadota bacterium]MCF7868749.1 type II secretion system GspH family protein [Candidatus Cloacimonadota bacterium]MCF7884151.1 type II secretion system GspH family protein [Candidatus Cloacimonadota bacterium]